MSEEIKDRHLDKKTEWISLNLDPRLEKAIKKIGWYWIVRIWILDFIRFYEYVYFGIIMYEWT